jgi:pimeloyl-ACP methyl ester carboxylesterase
MQQNIKKPSWILNLTEGFRATIDFMRCFFFLAFYKFHKKGNGEPIIVVPGLLGSDLSTVLLRWFLAKHGYTVYGWGLGRNLGQMDKFKAFGGTLATIFEKHQQKITLIGWSLGGVIVRETAKQNPEKVRQLFTLGSPFAALDAPNHALWVYKLLNNDEQIDPVWWAQIPVSAPVSTTAIYSKQDGIVPWQACIEVEDAIHKNVQVSGSHVGFTVNSAVFQVIADNL